MKCFAYSDEWYPVYSLTEKDTGLIKDGVIELSAEEYADFVRVDNEFSAWQERIGEALNARPTP